MTIKADRSATPFNQNERTTGFGVALHEVECLQWAHSRSANSRDLNGGF